MPYIVISSTMDAASQHAAFRNSITLIEYHVDKEEKAECDKMEMTVLNWAHGVLPVTKLLSALTKSINLLISCSTDWKPRATRLLEQTLFQIT